MEQSPPWEATCLASVLKKFVAFYGTQMLMTVFTRTVRWSPQ